MVKRMRSKSPRRMRSKSPKHMRSKSPKHHGSPRGYGSYFMGGLFRNKDDVIEVHPVQPVQPVQGGKDTRSLRKYFWGSDY